MTRKAGPQRAATWEDGTPRSTGGPFDILYQPRKSYKPLASDRAKQLAAAKAAFARNNSNCGFSIYLPSQADADKQQRIKKSSI